MHFSFRRTRTTTRLALLALVMLATGGCALQAAISDTQPRPSPATPESQVPARAPDDPTPTAVPQAVTLSPLGYTYQRADGNRLIAGTADLPNTPPLDLELAGTAKWVTAVPLSDTAVLWGIVLDNEFTQAFIVEAGSATPVNITPPVLANATPLLGVINGEAIFYLGTTNNPGGNHPVRLSAAGDHAYSEATGRLFVVDVRNQPLGNVDDVTIMPDNRMLVDENGRLLILTDPTTRYNHGVLGNDVEAGSITLLASRPAARVEQTITLTDGVVEGLSPIWTDWNGDGQREIIVTVSNALQGAQIVVFNEAGERVAAGPAVGQGYRWRHQIAVAPFGPAGELELAGVLTPHLGGVVEFYRWEGARLEVVATLPGYTSHVLGSDNLDMAAAGDFDGDGRAELLLPNQERTELAAIRRTAAGAEAAWALPLDAALTSNIGATTLADGRVAVGVGLANSHLRIWQP